MIDWNGNGTMLFIPTKMKSAGTLLREARLRKDISYEEATRATKIRRDQLSDLENDDYSRFASVAYAKGFLLIYSKYLGVDVSEFAKSLAAGNPVGTADYDYLNNSTMTYEPAIRRPPKKKLNFKLTLAIFAICGCVLWAWQFSLKLALVGSPDRFERKHKAEEIAAPQTTAPPPAAAPSPVEPPAPPMTPSSIPSSPAIASIPEPSPEPTIEVRRAEPVNESDQETQPAATRNNDDQTQPPHKSRTH